MWFLDREEALRIVRIDRELMANSSVFERNPRLLLTVSAVEMFLNVLLLAFLPVFLKIVWKSGVVHVNFRLQLCTFAVNNSLGILGRFIIFYTQYTGNPDEEVLHYFIPAEFARLAANVFAENQIACFALDRTFATFFWSWYERGTISTRIVFLLAESFNASMFALSAYLKYHTSMDYVFAQNMLVASAGFLGFALVYNKNRRTLARMKSGAQVGSYSVSRTFQVKENIEVIKYMSWVGRGWIFAMVSSSFSYSYFKFGPDGYDTSRALSYCMFEICVALHFIAFYALSVTGNKHILKQFLELPITRAIFNCRRVKTMRDRATPKIDLKSETDHYFMHFNNSWR